MVCDKLFLAEFQTCIVSVPSLLYKIITGAGFASAVHIISLWSARFGFGSPFPLIVTDDGVSKIRLKHFTMGKFQNGQSVNENGIA